MVVEMVRKKREGDERKTIRKQLPMHGSMILYGNVVESDMNRRLAWYYSDRSVRGNVPTQSLARYGEGPMLPLRDRNEILIGVLQVKYLWEFLSPTSYPSRSLQIRYQPLVHKGQVLPESVLPRLFVAPFASYLETVRKRYPNQFVKV